MGPNFAELRREKGSGFGLDGRCSMEVMRRIGLNLLESLESLHSAGFIHRDVKPANFVALRGELCCETGAGASDALKCSRDCCSPTATPFLPESPDFRRIFPVLLPAATFRLVDFGLSRRFVDDSHQPLPERHDTAFRGSTTYASVNAHLGRDLSRRDDLWSWLYILVEMMDGAPSTSVPPLAGAARHSLLSPRRRI